MDNIYNYLKHVWLDIATETKANPVFGVLLLILCTLLMPLGVNNILIGIYGLIVIFSFKKNQKFSIGDLWLPMALFLWGILSIFWSVDPEESYSVTRQIGLFLIPTFFIFQKKISQIQAQKIVYYFSCSLVLYALFYLIRACVRFFQTQNLEVFFYHELVTNKVNAIYVSAVFFIGFFNFHTQKQKTKFQYIAQALIGVVLVLLSSKNFLIITLLLLFVYHGFVLNPSKKKQRFLFLSSLGFLVLLGLIAPIRERFLIELQGTPLIELSQDADEIKEEGIGIVSISEAWNNEKFSPNDYFPGTAFRVYQIRIFKEFLNEENIFWFGFGFNASKDKILEKGTKYDVFKGDDQTIGYDQMNFHNQYVQCFAELGIVGFVLICFIVFANFKNALYKQDFLHFCFALMILALFLTESFLWRQRGVVFFIVFYCLMNTVDAKIRLKSNNKTDVQSV